MRECYECLFVGVHACVRALESLRVEEREGEARREGWIMKECTLGRVMTYHGEVCFRTKKREGGRVRLRRSERERERERERGRGHVRENEGV